MRTINLNGYIDEEVWYPDRCEKQIAVFNTHSEVSICSGIVEEFTTDPNTVDTRRVPPETNAEIIEFAKKRNPFNHPCVMYKKSAVEAVGSYQDFYLLEDYYLWLRMLMAGYQGYNIQEPLLHMRAGSDMYLRRAGWKYAKTQTKLFKFMKQQGFIGEGQYIKSCVIRSGSALAPNWLRKFMFEKVLVGHDFGDAIRFAANFVEEDCPQADKAGVNLNIFWAFAEGFIKETAATLTEAEVNTLGISCFALACELATRFLDDYILGDKYFKIKYPEHNLVRTRCQIALAKDMRKKMDAMNAIARDCWERYR